MIEKVIEKIKSIYRTSEKGLEVDVKAMKKTKRVAFYLHSSLMGLLKRINENVLLGSKISKIIINTINNLCDNPSELRDFINFAKNLEDRGKIIDVTLPEVYNEFIETLSKEYGFNKGYVARCLLLYHLLKKLRSK